MRGTTPALAVFSIFAPFAIASGAVLVEGTLVRVVPQGIVVKTASGEVPVAIARTNRVVVRAPLEISKLPDGAPCRLQSAAIQKGAKEITQAFLLVAGPQAGPFDDHVMIQADGRVSFQNTPGVLRKGPPAAFQVGPRAEVLTLDAGGRLGPASRQQAALFLGQTIPLAAGNLGGMYDFGSDLRMAGADAKVSVVGNAGNPAAATINIERVEPLPTMK